MCIYIHTAHWNCSFSYSYVGVTIGPTYKYQSEPYDRAKEARKVRVIMYMTTYIRVYMYMHNKNGPHNNIIIIHR